jgi:hypothetical protein
MSSKTQMFKHPKGIFDLLTTENYASWAINMRRILRSSDAWDIVTGDEEEPDQPAPNASERVRQAFKDYRHRKEDAATYIFNGCCKTVKVMISGTDDPKEMWDKLASKLNTANSALGRQQLHQKFLAMRPKAGAPIADFFTELEEIRNQIAGTDEAISDTTFKTHIFNYLPPAFAMTINNQQNRPEATIESICTALIEDERLRSMKSSADAAVEALKASTKPPRRKKRCNHCKTATHDTAECWYKDDKDHPRRRSKRPRDDSDDDKVVCYYCCETGHQLSKCPLRQKARSIRKKASVKKDSDSDEGADL